MKMPAEKPAARTALQGGAVASVLRNLLLVLAGSVLLALSAKVSVPFFPVPMTLQTLAVLLVGATYGSRLGALTVLAAYAAGATKIFVSEPNPNRRRLIESLGVTQAVLDPTKDDVVQVIRDATEEGVGVDSAIEAVGNEAALNLCVDAVRNRGTVVQLGLHVKRASIDAALWAMKDITVEATYLGGARVYVKPS